MPVSLSDLLVSYLVPSSQPKIRYFHGRGKTVPELEWLTVDCFAPVLVATVFREQDETVLGELRDMLRTVMVSLACTSVVIQFFTYIFR